MLQKMQAMCFPYGFTKIGRHVRLGRELRPPGNHVPDLFDDLLGAFD